MTTQKNVARPQVVTHQDSNSGASKLATGLHYPVSLGSLPLTWRVGYVGDFAVEVQPGFASGKHNNEGKGVPHIRPFNIDRQGKLDLSDIKSVAPDSDVKRLKDGDVLFNNTNSPELIGKTAAISSPGDWGFSNHMTRIRFKDDVAPKFAAYQLHFLWMTGYFLHNCVKHVNQASISSKTLAHAVPFIAPPLDQQKQIVAEIEKQFSRLDEAVANLKRLKANLKRYKAAVLKAAVQGRLVETEANLARREGRSCETGAQLLQRILETRRSRWQGKGKYKEPAVPDTTDLPELPEGWVFTSLDSLLREPLRNGHSAKATDDPNGLRVFTLSAVTEGDFSETNTKHTIADRVKVADLWAQPGDIYVERSNTPELVGTARLYRGPKNFAFIPDLLIRVRLCEQVLAEFVEISLLSESGRGYFKSRAQGIAGSMPKIDQSVVERFAIRLPPLAEQRRVATEVDSRLSMAREAVEQIDINLKRAESLRQSLLTSAFAGQIPLSARP